MFLLAVVPARPASLTGFYFYGTTATGANLPGTARWNTLGFEMTTPNLYVNQGSTQITTGNGANERLNVPLSPGTYDFTWCAQPFAVGLNAFFGVDLYFNGNDGQPLITALVPIKSLITPVANPNPTFALDGVTAAASANTISITLDNLLIRLVYANVPNDLLGTMDRVSLFNDVPDGQPDCGPDGIGLRISVTALPEPATGAMMISAFGCLVLRFRRARR